MASSVSFKQMCPSCEALVPIRDPKLVGRKIDCPKCKYRFVVEEPEDAEDSSPRKAKKEASEEVGKKPGKKGKGARSKKGGSSSMVLIGGGIALVAIVALAVGLIFMLGGSDSSVNAPISPMGGSATPGGGPAIPSTPTSQDQVVPPTPPATVALVENITNLLPNDTEAIFSLDVQQMRRSSLRRVALDNPGSFLDRDFQNTFGVSFDEVSRVLVALNSSRGWIFSILRFSKPVGQDDLIARLRLSPEAPINGLTYYHVRRDLDSLSSLLLKGSQPREQMMAHFLDGQTLVFADAQPMQEFLQAGARPRPLTQSPAAPTPPGATTPEGAVPSDPAAPAGSTPPAAEAAPEGAAPAGAAPATSPATPEQRAEGSWLTVNPALKLLLDRLDNGKPAIFMGAENDQARLTRLAQTLRPLLPPEAAQLIEERGQPVLQLARQEVKRVAYTLRELSEDRVSLVAAFDTRSEEVARGAERLIRPLLRPTPPPVIGPEGQPIPVDPASLPPMDSMVPMDGFTPGMSQDNQPLSITARGQALYVTLSYPLREPEYRKVVNGAESLIVWLKSDADLIRSGSRVHELAEALRKYVADKGHFPRGTVDRPAARDRLTPWLPDQRLSWVAELLPYLEEGYRTLPVDPTRSWNEEPNLRTGQVVIPQLIVSGKAGERTHRIQYPGQKGILAPTHFVGIAGVGLDAAEYAADSPMLEKKRGVFGYDRATKLEDIKDGLEQTIVLLQVPGQHRTPWIAGGGSTVRGVSEETDAFLPFICPPPPEKKERGALAIMGDGKVRFIPGSIDPRTFRALCTVAGGEEIEDLEAIAPEIPRPVVMAPPPVAPSRPSATPPATTPPATTPPATPRQADPQPAQARAPQGPPPPAQAIPGHLRNIGVAYHSFHDTMARGPASIDQLAPFLENNQQIIDPVKRGHYVIFWNVRFSTLRNGISGTVLGYEYNATSRGGRVLMADGSVRTMSADELKRAPKPN